MCSISARKKTNQGANAYVMTSAPIQLFQFYNSNNSRESNAIAMHLFRVEVGVNKGFFEAHEYQQQKIHGQNAETEGRECSIAILMTKTSR